MREHGTGVLFITHDFGVVAEIADRVAVLKHGELVELGTRRRGAARAEARLHEDADRGGAEHDAARTRASSRRRRWCARRGPEQDVRRRAAGRRAPRRARGRGRRARDPARRDARHRRRVRVGQVDRRALHRAAGRPNAGTVQIDGVEIATLRAGACARCAARSRSCSRIRTARSIRAAPSARRSSKGR